MKITNLLVILLLAGCHEPEEPPVQSPVKTKPVKAVKSKVKVSSPHDGTCQASRYFGTTVVEKWCEWEGYWWFCEAITRNDSDCKRGSKLNLPAEATPAPTKDK